MSDNEKKPKSPLGKRIDLAQAFREKPVLDFVFPGYLSNTVGVIVAPGSTGKSMLALQLLISVALGRDIFGLFPDGTVIPAGRVILINVEDPEEIIHSRIHQFGGILNQDDIAELIEKLDVYSLQGSGFTISQKVSGGVLQQSLSFLDAISAIKEASPRLVVWDTMNRLAGGAEENSNSEMGQVMSYLEQLNKQVGCSSLIVHHSSKAAALQGQGGLQQAGRGASAVTDNARFQINLSGLSKERAEELGYDEDGRRKWVCMTYAKINYGAPLSDTWLRREAGGTLTGQTLDPEEHAEHFGLRPKNNKSRKNKSVI